MATVRGRDRREILRGLLGASVGYGLLGCGSGSGGGGSPGPLADAAPPSADAGDAAAAGGSGGADAGPIRPRVAIVGAGTAGITLAWLLDGEADVVLYEANPELGGNVKAVAIPGRDPPAWVDLGAQYFHPRTHETFARLLAHLGLFDPDAPGTLGVHETASTVTLFAEGEADPRFVSPARPDRLWAVGAPWNADGVAAFAALSTAGAALEREDGPWETTVTEFLAGLALTEAQRERIVLPLCAAVNNSDVEVARTLSARAAFTFISRNVPPNPLDPVVNYVLIDGLGAAHRALIAACSTVTVRTNSRVAAVRSGDAPRGAGGPLLLTTEGGETTAFDAVVLAAAPRNPLAMLGGIRGGAGIVSALEAVQTYPTTMTLHRDPLYAPADPMHRSLVNARHAGGFCEASMYVGAALPPGPDGAPVELWKSWTTHREIQPADIVAQAEFRHLLTSPQSIGAARRLRDLQGTAGLHFCGVYTDFIDSQDTAVESALAVAERLAAVAAHLRAFQGT